MAFKASLLADDMSGDESQEEDASDGEDLSGLESGDEELMEEGGDDDMGDMQLNGDLAGVGPEADDSDSDLGDLDDEPMAGQVLDQPAAAAAGVKAQLLDDEDEDDALDGVGDDSLDSDEDEDGDEEGDEDEDELLDIEKRAQALDSSRYALLKATRQCHCCDSRS